MMSESSPSSTSSAPRKFNAQRLGWTLLVLFTIANIGYTIYLNQNYKGGDAATGPVRVALTVGSQDPYWEELIAGAKEAAEELDVDLQIHQPEDLESQNRFLNKMLNTRGADAVALSPVSAERQRDLINSLSGAMDVVTIDSDAPTTRRRFYIGTNNYDAGRQCGELIREMLPDGGKIVVSVGSLEKVNGQERCMGLIDALFGREVDDSRTFPTDATRFEAEGYTVLLYSDGTDAAVARQMMDKAIQENPDAACFVGIYGYNTPQILAAMDEAGKLGAVRVVGFDTAEQTLQGIRDGHVEATLVQQTRKYGYDAVWALAKSLRQDNPPTTTNRLHRCTVLTKENLDSETKSEADEPLAKQ